jgi:signal peptidase I
MAPVTSRPRFFNIRLTMYRIVKQLLTVFLLCVAGKYLLCDTVPIRSGQMEPQILDGDRVLIARTCAAVPLKWFFPAGYNDLIIYTYPHTKRKVGCLRLAGKPGDTINVTQGVFTLSGKPEVRYSGNLSPDEILPQDFSPRDNMDPYYLPGKGESVTLPELSIRNFIFLYAMILQERPHAGYSLHPTLLIDDSATTSYPIRDFPLYSGDFNGIPDSLYTDWFFWDRLQAYLLRAEEEKKITLRFSLMKDSLILDKYTMKRNFVFLLSDNWCKGYDSRYFGPVLASAIHGRVAGILWSINPQRRGIFAIRGRRILKLITNRNVVSL